MKYPFLLISILLIPAVIITLGGLLQLHQELQELDLYCAKDILDESCKSFGLGRASIKQELYPAPVGIYRADPLRFECFLPRTRAFSDVEVYGLSEEIYEKCPGMKLKWNLKK